MSERPNKIPYKNHPSLSLREVFSIYLDAVQKSDLIRLFTTVTEDEEFLFITARGNLIDTKEGYRNFHEEWFNQINWEMPTEIVKVYETPQFGYVTALFHYRELDPNTHQVLNGVDSYFTLLFRKENGLWKVFADICSPITRFTSSHTEKH